MDTLLRYPASLGGILPFVLHFRVVLNAVYEAFRVLMYDMQLSKGLQMIDAISYGRRLMIGHAGVLGVFEAIY